MSKSYEVKIDEQVLMANPCEFKTGSKGMRANGQVFLDGKKYQTNVMLIEIGSKPKDKK